MNPTLSDHQAKGMIRHPQEEVIHLLQEDEMILHYPARNKMTLLQREDHIHHLHQGVFGQAPLAHLLLH